MLNGRDAFARGVAPAFDEDLASVRFDDFANRQQTQSRPFDFGMSIEATKSHEQLLGLGFGKCPDPSCLDLES